MRKRKRRSRSEQIAFMEFSSELTRSDRAAQCLETTRERRHIEQRHAGHVRSEKVQVRPRLPSHLEDPEQADAAQHGDADGRDGVKLHEQSLQDAAEHHDAIEAVEQRHEIDL